jgi:transposase
VEEALTSIDHWRMPATFKDDLRQIWNQPNKPLQKRHSKTGLIESETSGIGTLEEFAKTLTTRMAGIVDYYDYTTSTVPLEANNNKIKTMQRQAYGC